MAGPGSQRRLEQIDLLGLSIGGLWLLCSFATGLLAVPRFSKIIADLGGEAPALTQLVLRPWFTPLIGCAPLMIVADGVRRRASTTNRALRTATALAIIVGEFALFLVAANLPLFSMHSALK